MGLPLAGGVQFELQSQVGPLSLCGRGHWLKAGVHRADSGKALTGRAKAESDGVKKLKQFNLNDDALGLSSRRAEGSTTPKSMLRLAQMMAQKPESVGEPPGGAMVI